MEIGQMILNLLIAGILRAGVYGLITVSMVLLVGVMDMFSFCQGDIAMVGGYIGYFLIISGVDPTVTLLITAIATLLIGYAINKGLLQTLRRRIGIEDWRSATFIFTFAISVCIENLLIIIIGPFYKSVDFIWPGSISILGFTTGIDRVMMVLMTYGSAVALLFFISKTRIGRAIRAVSMNETAALLTGVDNERIHSIAFSVAALLCGIGGLMLIPAASISPSGGGSLSIAAFTILVIAGFKSIKGAIICSVAVGILETVVIYFTAAGWQNVVTLVIVIIIMLVKPRGIFSKESL